MVNIFYKIQFYVVSERETKRVMFVNKNTCERTFVLLIKIFLSLFEFFAIRHCVTTTIDYGCIDNHNM